MPFVETSRGKFYVEDWGGQGPVVCLLHGLTCDHSDWDEIAPRLVEAGFQVLGPDMKGHGKSEKPDKGYSPEELAIDLAAIFQTLGVSQIHVVGHSTGGRNGLLFAHLFPARTLSLTLIDQTLSVDHDRWKEAEKDYAQFPTPFADEGSLVQFLKDRYPDRPKKVDFVRSQFEKKDAGLWDWIHSVRAVVETHRLGREKELHFLLSELKCPVLFMKGAESTYVSAEEEKKIQKLIRKGRFVTVEQAKHGVFRDNPEAFLKVLIDFLRGCKSKPTSF